MCVLFIFSFSEFFFLKLISKVGTCNKLYISQAGGYLVEHENRRWNGWWLSLKSLCVITLPECIPGIRGAVVLQRPGCRR